MATTTPATTTPADHVRDAKVEYGRACSARTRIATAILELTSARAEVSVTVGEQHPATAALAEALLAARVAHGKLDIIIRHLGRIQ